MTGTASSAASLRDADPTQLHALRAALAAADPHGTLAPIGMRHVRIGEGTLDDLPALVDEVRAAGPIVIIQDATPMRRGSGDLKALVAELLAGRGSVEVATLGAAGEPLHADAAALAEADRAIVGAGCVVAVGSGTVCDVAKDATHRAGGIPYVVVQTAVSVNAFSDDMAVLLRDGVKRTIPSRWPDVLVVDARVVTDAPAALTRAGYGELASNFTAPADWALAGIVGADGAYHPTAVALVRDSADRWFEIADGVRTGDERAMLELARLMTLSGMTMGVAGRTAPCSGTEHVISHLLDMDAASRGVPTALHGSQVGIGAVLAAVVWRRVLAELDPERLVATVPPSPELMEGRVQRAFARLDADGRAVAECWHDYRAKLASWTARRSSLVSVVARWDEHRAALEALLEVPERIAGALQDAGAPTRFAQLDPPVDAGTARWAIENCFLMRNRFGIVDLAFLGGVWTDAFVDGVLAEAGELGAGL